MLHGRLRYAGVPVNDRIEYVIRTAVSHLFYDGICQTQTSIVHRNPAGPQPEAPDCIRF